MFPLFTDVSASFVSISSHCLISPHTFLYIFVDVSVFFPQYFFYSLWSCSIYFLFQWSSLFDFFPAVTTYPILVSLFPWSKDGWCSLVVDVTCPWTFPNFLPIRCCFRFQAHWTCSLAPFWSVSWSLALSADMFRIFWKSMVSSQFYITWVWSWWLQGCDHFQHLHPCVLWHHWLIVYTGHWLQHGRSDCGGVRLEMSKCEDEFSYVGTLLILWLSCC